MVHLMRRSAWERLSGKRCVRCSYPFEVSFEKRHFRMFSPKGIEESRLLPHLPGAVLFLLEPSLLVVRRQPSPLIAPAVGSMGYLPVRLMPGWTRRSRFGTRRKGQASVSEAAGRAQMERTIVERSLQDDAFRKRLLADPKAALEELGIRLPEAVRVVAVGETADPIYLVLP